MNARVGRRVMVAAVAVGLVLAILDGMSTLNGAHGANLDVADVSSHSTVWLSATLGTN